MREELFEIRLVDALQVLDSRGDPTIEVIVATRGGVGRAIAPAGASRGAHEAWELRDGDPKKFHGRSVYRAIEVVKKYIDPSLRGIDSRLQREIDNKLISMDGTPNKSRLGGNTTTATSLAVLKAAADTYRIPVFRYLGGLRAKRLPIPMMNIINGGVHAGNNLAFQEFMIVPLRFRSFSDALRAGVEIYKTLKEILKQRYGASAINVGDEGGYAPPLSRVEDALKLLAEAISRAGYVLAEEVYISIDAAASQFYDENKSKYVVDGREYSSEELLDLYLRLADEYKLLSIEDPFHEEDFESFSKLTNSLKRTRVVGDDHLTTNINRLRESLAKRSVSSVLVKINQIGTFSEAQDFVRLAKDNNLFTIVSHRSGDSEDNIIAHIAVGLESEFIKTGAPARSERTSKYNELLRIEHYLGEEAEYFGDKLKLG